MYSLLLISLLTLVKANPFVEDFTICHDPFYDDPPICGPKHLSPEKYPYLALVFLNCGEKLYGTKYTAVIISAKYLVGMDPNQLSTECDSYSAQIGADEQGRRGIMYETKLIVQQDQKGYFIEDEIYNTKLVLYKLSEPIKFNLRAKPISIAKKRAKTGDGAIAIGFNGNVSGSWPKIFEMNRYVTSREDSKDLESYGTHLPEGSLTTVHPLYECVTPVSSALIVDGQLIGLMFNFDEVYNGAEGHIYGSCDKAFVWIDGYIDVVYHRGWIENHSDIRSINFQAKPLQLVSNNQSNTCWSANVWSGEFPYLAMVILDCDKYIPQPTSTAAVISPYFVLGLNANPNAFKCKYTVRVGTDERGKDGFIHTVEKVIKYEAPGDDVNPMHQLVLYKLTEPMKFDPWLDWIKISQERPKTGDSGMLTGFRSGDRTGFGSKIFRMSRNVTSEEDWRALYDKLPSEKQRQVPKGSLSTIYSSDGCPRVVTSVLVVNGQLAGFMCKPGKMLIDGKSFEADGYVDVAYYRDWIKNNTKIKQSAGEQLKL